LFVQLSDVNKNPTGRALSTILLLNMYVMNYPSDISCMTSVRHYTVNPV